MTPSSFGSCLVLHSQNARGFLMSRMLHISSLFWSMYCIYSNIAVD